MDQQAEWTRLQEVYGGMTDGELLELAERPEELTEVAQEVLGRELAARGLEVAKGEPIDAAPEREHELRFGEGGKAVRTSFSLESSNALQLTTLRDALQTSDACAYLEEEEIPFEVRDASPPVAFAFLVPATELERAKAVLRERMGLFPLQEVEVADEPVDDGTLSILGCFATVAEADEVAAGLREAGFWCEVTDKSDSDDKDPEFPVLVEVREVDLMRALAACEAAGAVEEGVED